METKEKIQDLALQAILPYKRAGVNISMGTGKTLLGLNHMEDHYTDYCRFLVVAPKKSIFQSWKDDIEKFNMQHLLPHITFTTYISLSKQDTDYDVVYLDEMHNLLGHYSTWLELYNGNILGLTGTPPKSKHSTKSKMISKYCPIVYTYSTDTAIDDAILNDYEIKIHMLSLSSEKSIKMTKGDKQWYTSEQDTYDYWTRRIDDALTGKEVQITRLMRMKAMMEFPSKEYLTKVLMNQIPSKCLIFANTIEQSLKLCSHSYNSKDALSLANLQLFKEGVINQLSCVLMLSEGVNIPDLKESIILHSYGASSPKGLQRLGRCLRLNPKDKAIINVLCYKNTVDEKWCKDSFSSLDQSKIKYV